MGTSNSLQYLIWSNSRTVKIYSVVQSVKFLLALSIPNLMLRVCYSTVLSLEVQLDRLHLYRRVHNILLDF